MSAPIIWNGDFAKLLKSQLKLSENVYLLSGSADPTSVSKNAPASSLYFCDNGNIYKKNDSGDTTNWSIIDAGPVNWGTIGGNLANQTDLQTALNGKQPTGSYLTSLSGGVTTVGNVATVASVGGKTAAQVSTSVDDTNTAVSTNTASAIVKRDSGGNFAAGTITANINGNISGSAGSFTGNLAGDITGTQSATTIAAHVITNGKIRQSVARSILGNASASTSDIADISATTDGQVLRRSGTTLAFGALDLAAAAAVTNSLPATRGGTGLNALATGSLLVGTATPTMTAISIQARGTYLRSSGNTPYWDTEPLDKKICDWDNLSARAGIFLGNYVRIPEHILGNSNFIQVYKNGTLLTYSTDYTFANSESTSGKKIFVNGEQDADPQYLIDTMILMSSPSFGDVFRVVYTEWRKVWQPRVRLNLWDFINNDHIAFPHNTTPALTHGPHIQKRFSNNNTGGYAVLTNIANVGYSNNATYDASVKAFYLTLTYNNILDFEVHHYIANAVHMLDFPSDYDWNGNAQVVEIWNEQQQSGKHGSNLRYTPVGYHTDGNMLNMARPFLDSKPRNSKRRRRFKFRIRDLQNNIVTDWSDLSFTAIGPFNWYSQNIRVGQIVNVI